MSDSFSVVLTPERLMMDIHVRVGLVTGCMGVASDPCRDLELVCITGYDEFAGKELCLHRTSTIVFTFTSSILFSPANNAIAYMWMTADSVFGGD